MATIADVRGIFRHIPSAVVSAKKEGYFPVMVDDVELRLSAQSIKHYFTIQATVQQPLETSLFYPGYYEHLIDSQHYYVSRTIDSEKKELILSNNDGSRKASICNISDVFIFTLLQQEKTARIVRRHIRLYKNRFHREDSEDNSNLSTMFSRFKSFRLETGADDPLKNNVQKMQEIAQSVIFNFVYCLGINLNLSNSWEREYYRFGFRRQESVQFPLRTYNSELIAYYHLAFGSDSLILAYLALYKILEYFFTSASEKLLHAHISNKLAEPDFLHTKPKKLRELATIIRSHDNRMDEKKMLATVIKMYFEPEEIRTWVNKYEVDERKYYTEENEIFAEKHKVDLSDDQIFTRIAGRIYHIRNALVHCKEGEVSRFIPFSGQEKILHKEMPILLYLAEQIIIKTGKNIS